ncbi:MAG: ethanolamine ammonia-lyase subunit EutC [Acidobacteria bacterium]|nr:ethanolamine ammonia-lyase subunit EutC [Acidobacteriota bacterium]
MADESDPSLVAAWPQIVQKIRARTPARILVGCAGAAYRTATQLDLREAHAAARDAVRAELNLGRDLGSEFVKKWNLFEVSTRAGSKEEYMLRPDLGRVLNEVSRAEIQKRCEPRRQLQIIIGDGLSVSAVAAQVPALLPLICNGARALGWTLGGTFIVRHCRVGVLNDVGELLQPEVAVLLIGERPGLATAESLSAYMAYRPNSSHTDADRNLVSNIHARGVSVSEAASRILNLAARMIEQRSSGCMLREELSGKADSSLRSE